MLARLGWQFFSGANALAYFSRSVNDGEKKFYKMLTDRQ
jgi:hypothetical protein